MQDRFWESKSLEELDEEEWEALCDGCAQCCRLRFRRNDTAPVMTTSLACRLLDIPTRRCTKYPRRHELVPECVELDVDKAKTFDWLPDTCAYRLMANGQSLPDWHPLISGTHESVTRAGVSVAGQVISAANVELEDIEANLMKWV